MGSSALCRTYATPPETPPNVSRRDVLVVSAAVPPKAAPSPSPWTPNAAATRTGIAKPYFPIANSGEKIFRLRSTEKKKSKPITKSPTIATWPTPPEKPELTSRLAAPVIVSTNNQNKIPKANAATYLACNFIPANTIRNNPTNAGIIVDAVHGRKLSANPSMSRCLDRSVLRVFGSNYEQCQNRSCASDMEWFLVRRLSHNFLNHRTAISLFLHSRRS